MFISSAINIPIVMEEKGEITISHLTTEMPKIYEGLENEAY